MEKLDIHDRKKNLDLIIENIHKSDMSAKQKAQTNRFILEAQMGKNSKKRVGESRIIANLNSFLNLHRYFKKDFEKIKEEDVEKFQRDLDRDKFRQRNGKPYKKTSKDEIIRGLKRFTRWIWKDDEKYKKIVGWLKEYDEKPEIPAITKEQAEKLANKSLYLRDKALILFLFDSGCRIEEALNLKISSIEKKRKKDGEEFYIVDIKISKTLPRRISVPLVSKILTEWLKEHPEATNKDAYLFPVNYDAFRMALARLSKKSLGMHVTPHQLRHSSATYYCKIINNPYKFCYRYGWTIGSNEARRYIDRNLLGEEEQEQLDNLIKTSRVEELESELETMKKEFGKYAPLLEAMKRTLDKNAKARSNLKKEFGIVVTKEK